MINIIKSKKKTNLNVLALKLWFNFISFNGEFKYIQSIFPFFSSVNFSTNLLSVADAIFKLSFVYWICSGVFGSSHILTLELLSVEGFCVCGDGWGYYYKYYYIIIIIFVRYWLYKILILLIYMKF